MIIPYYSKDAGIKTYAANSIDDFYVVLDKAAIDNFHDNVNDIWDTFENVRAACQIELGIPISINTVIYGLSPHADEVYIVNFQTVDSGAVQ